MKRSSALAILVQRHPESAELLAIAEALRDNADTVAQLFPFSQRGTAVHTFGQGSPRPHPLPEFLLADIFADEEKCTAFFTLLLEAGQGCFPKASSALAETAGRLPHIADACSSLPVLGFSRDENALAEWAERFGFESASVAFFAEQVAQVAARRLKKAATQPVMPDKESPFCPVCGAGAQAALLRHKEGRRTLFCAFCETEWPFRRTICPACGCNEPSKLPYFFSEDTTDERIEVCTVCKTYIPCLDLRATSGDIPPALHLVALLPLEITVQEKGYHPLSVSAMRDATMLP